MPVPGVAPNLASESVSVNGSSSGSLMSSMSSDEMQQRMRESREQDSHGPGLGGPLGGLGPPGGAPPPGGGRPGAGGPPPGGFFGWGRREARRLRYQSPARFDLLLRGRLRIECLSVFADWRADDQALLLATTVWWVIGWAVEHSQDLPRRQQDIFLRELQRIAL